METASRRSKDETKDARRAVPSARAADAQMTAQAPAVELAWLTVEKATYAAIFAVALAVRFAALGRWPLLSDELNTALAAWRGVKGMAWRPAYYVPFQAYKATEPALAPNARNSYKGKSTR